MLGNWRERDRETCTHNGVSRLQISGETKTGLRSDSRLRRKLGNDEKLVLRRKVEWSLEIRVYEIFKETKC